MGKDWKPSMKRILAPFLVATALAAFSQPINAESIGIPQNDVTIYYEVMGAEVTITEFGFGGHGDLAIPAYIEGHPVTAISNWALDLSNRFSSITIPETVLSLGDDLFHRSRLLSRIEVSPANPNFSSLDGILYTKDKKDLLAYPEARAGTTFEIPDTVESIGNHAFHDASALESIVIPSSVTQIGESAFDSCSALVSLSLPMSVESIGSGIFEWCSSLNNIDVSPENPHFSSIDGVLFDKDATILLAFPGGRSGSYTAPGGVRTIAESAFHACETVVEIVLPEGVETIENEAFYLCDSLVRITLPDSVTSIGDRSFAYCSMLNEIRLPENLTHLGESSFSNCRSLTTVSIPGNLDSIPNFAFTGCPELKNIVLSEGISSIGTGAFSHCRSISSISIPSTVLSIGPLAFSGCTSLEAIQLPESTNVVEAYAFAGCTSLVGIGVAEGNPNFTSSDGVLYDRGGTTLVSFAPGKAGSFTIPSNVQRISEGAFDGSSSLTEVIIPSGILTIEEATFRYCSSLTRVSLPEGLIQISDNAFYQCTSLAEIVLPQSLVSIGTAAFYKCSSLANVNLPEEISTIGGSAFFSCTSLDEVRLPASLLNIGANAFGSCTSLTGIEVAADHPIYASLDGVLYSKDGREIVIFPAGKPAGDYRIPETVVSIGDYAFYGCSLLTSVTFPSSIDSIGNFAFRKCSIEYVIFEGDAPGSAGDGMFDFHGLELYHYSDAQGFSAPSWDGFSLISRNRPEVRISRLPDGGVEVHFEGQLERSSDLKTWTPIDSASESPFCFEPGAGIEVFRATD